jgi:hypothetical protein
MTNQRWKAVCGDRQMGGWGLQRTDGSIAAFFTGSRQEAEALAAEHNSAIDEIERLRAAVEPTAPYVRLVHEDGTEEQVSLTAEPPAEPKAYTVAELTRFDTPELTKIREDFGMSLATAIEADLRYKPVLERASNTREGWVAEMEQAHDGEWVPISALKRPTEPTAEPAYEKALQRIVGLSDLEMRDGDGAREIARNALNRRAE